MKEKTTKKTEIKKTKREKSIPESKIKSVKELEELLKTKKTVLVVSIKNIPGSQFQEIVKKLRGKAIVKVPKKNLVLRALDGKKELLEIKEELKESFAMLFSDMDCFALAGELMKNQSPVKAKTGQESPENIEIPAGPTDLVPGPAVSELGALGIKIQIEGGKITIKEPKTIVKAGAKISEGANSLMNKLGIKPFKVGFVPLCAFDTQEKIFYNEIKVDRKGAIEELKKSHRKGLAFALEIGYYSRDTITFFLGKANAHFCALSKFAMQTQTPDENKSEGDGDK